MCPYSTSFISPSKGGQPVASDQVIAPTAYRSVHGPKSRHRHLICSGAMYSGVPWKSSSVGARSSPRMEWASPKSVSLTFRSA